MNHYLYTSKRVHNRGGSDELPIDTENERRICWTISTSNESFNRWELYKLSGQYDLIDYSYEHKDGAFSLAELRTRRKKDGSDGSYSTMFMSFKKMMGLFAASVKEQNKGKALKHLLYVWGWPRETFYIDLARTDVMEWLGKAPPEVLKSDAAKGKFGEGGERGYYVPRALATCVQHPPVTSTPWGGKDDCFYPEWKELDF